MLFISLFRETGAGGGARGTGRRSRLSGVLLSMIALLVMVGCGSSSDFDTASGGNVAAVSFRLPAGETMTVTEDLTVVAEEDINIEGDLLFSPGVNITLVAGNEIVVDGRIVPQGALGRQLFVGHSQGRNPDVRAQSGTSNGNFLRLGSRTVRVSGRIEGSQGMNIFIANRNAGASTAIAIITGTVTAGPGEPGTSSTRGGKGGTVHLGSRDAIELFENRPAISGVDRVGQFSAPNRLEITGRVLGGIGGQGFEDSVGAGDVQGGTGGEGGDVQIGFRADTPRSEFLVTRGSVIGGTGGTGGSCVGRGEDGTADFSTGQAVNATTGDGGDGGDVVVVSSGQVFTDEIFVPGQAGKPGDSLVAAGNGGRAGKGGLLEITLGDFGAFGTTFGTSFQPPDIVPEVTVRLVNGGNGGQGLVDRKGGEGGTLALATPAEFAQGFNGVGARLKLEFENYGNGGKGFDSCGEDAAEEATDGGASGAIATLINDQLFLPLGKVPSASFKDCFNGGDGGDGDFPGAGGRGLTFSQPELVPQRFLLTQNFETSFKDGDPGGNCPGPPTIGDISGEFDLATGSEAPFATLIDLTQSPMSTLDIAGFRITRADNPNADFNIVTGCSSSIFQDNLGGGVAMNFETETVFNGECTWLNANPLSKDVLIFLDIEPVFTDPVNQLIVQALDTSGGAIGQITVPITKF